MRVFTLCSDRRSKAGIYTKFRDEDFELQEN